MFVVGLTGGVGSGKSTVASLLMGHGAYVIDADTAAREVLRPESAGFSQVLQRFGAKYLNTQGEVDRTALADLVFSDATALADLNAIVHPLVREHIRDELDAATADVVVLMVPLLIESGQYETDVVVVVDCDEDVAVRRLVETRGWSEQQARARIAAQLPRSERLAAADYVIDNNGSMEELLGKVVDLWAAIVARIG